MAIDNRYTAIAEYFRSDSLDRSAQHKSIEPLVKLAKVPRLGKACTAFVRSEAPWRSWLRQGFVDSRRETHH